MKVLVVGGGGREHAIIRKLKESPRRPALYAAPGNGGIASDAVCVPIAATNVAGVVSIAGQEGIDYVVAAPDDPLVLGMVKQAAGLSFGISMLAVVWLVCGAVMLLGAKYFYMKDYNKIRHE